MVEAIKAPFPYFGAKSRAADLIWDRLGDPPNYVEPFFGSGAVLLSRPTEARLETVNDKCCFLSNFWRAVSMDSDAVAHHADWPVNEADLHARHLWLVNNAEFQERMKTDPEYFDAKIAGWWCYGLSAWIGSGWCQKTVEKRPSLGRSGRGVHRKLPQVGGSGRGDERLSLNAVSLDDRRDVGVSRQLPHLGNSGRGLNRASTNDLQEYFRQLQDRLRRVRVCCGDWTRVLGPSVTEKNGITGIFLDPPYAGDTGRTDDLYSEDDLTISPKVREWAIANGDNPMLRICVAGYEGEHEFPPTWRKEQWKARGGYDGQNKDRDNQRRKLERLWFSPHCLKPMSLFEGAQ